MRASASKLVGALLAVSSLVCLRSAPARGDNALNSYERPSQAPSANSPTPKDDFTIVPVAGGSTDIGVGAGFFSALTRDQRGFVPYLWNVEAAGFVSFGLSNGKVIVPYTDDYIDWTVTRLFGRPIQLDLKADFVDERTLYYYGMGNASSASPPAGMTKRYFRYGRLHPILDSSVVFRLVDHVAGQVGIRYAASDLAVDPGSKLASDQRTASAEVQKLIGPLSGLQSVLLFGFGARFDTRDNAVRTHSGTFDEATIKLSPGGADGFPYRYAQATAIARGYVPLGHTRVTLAGRLVGDVLFGSAPFYELARFDDTYAVGGGSGVRGVPAQRYYGKAKLFGNLEARMPLFDFRIFKKPMTVGLAAFLDAGRVWADTAPHPELDGTGVGIKYGVGAGLRLMSGTAFVLRGDLAWSPDATPIGGYVAAGEIF